MPENTAEFFAARWQEAIRESSRQKYRLQEKDPVVRWNKRAADFAERTGQRQSCDQRDDTIAWLKKTGALSAAMEVLDIGSGPGNWAVPMAAECSRLVALEPAGAMLEILGNRVREGQIENITWHQSTWQDVDLDSLGWRGRFDLVFASMTPGVDSPEMLCKMMNACKPETGCCFMAAFAGRSWRQWYGDVWRKLFAEEMIGHGTDIIYPFNLIYALGYRPELRFEHWSRPISWSRDKAMEDFTTFFEDFTPMTDSVRAVIAEHIDARLQEGLFQDNRDGCRGMMVWSLGRKAV